MISTNIIKLEVSEKEEQQLKEFDCGLTKSLPLKILKEIVGRICLQLNKEKI